MKKTIRIRYLVLLSGFFAVISITVFLVHRSQLGNQAAACMHQANKAEEENKYSREIQYLSRYVRLKPTDLDARERLGIALLVNAGSDQDLRNGLSQLQQVVQEDPGRRQLRKKCVYAALDPRIAKYSEARTHLDFLINNEPTSESESKTDFELYDLRGRCQAALGEFDLAKKDFEEAIKLEPKSIPTYAHYLSFLLSRDASDPTANQKLLDEMIEVNGKNPRAYLLSAAYWKLRNDSEKRNLDLAKAQELAPNDPEVLLAVARSALEKAEQLRRSNQPDQRKRETEAACAILKQALKEQPEHIPEASRQAIVEGEDANGLKRAVFIQLYENLVATEFQLATEFQVGSLEEAEHHARAGIKALPEQSSLALQLVAILIDQAEQKKLQAASLELTNLQKAGYDPLVSLALRLIAILIDQAEHEKLQAASMELNNLQKAGYDPLVLEFYRAQILTKKRDWSTASQLLERIAPDLIDRRRLYRQVFFLLAQCYEALGDLDRTAKAYPRAQGDLERDALWVESTVRLAETYVAMGRNADAKVQYRSVLAIDKKYLRALIRLQRLDGGNSSDEMIDLIQKKPETLDELAIAVDILAARQEFKKAHEFLDQSREKYKEEIGFYVASALLSAAEQKLDDAQNQLQTAEEMFGDRVAIRLARARLLNAELEPKDLQQKFFRLSENAASFSLADQQNLLTVLAERAEELGSQDVAGELWNQLGELDRNNLTVHFKRFDYAQRKDSETVLLGIMDDISRVAGPDGTATRLAFCLYLIWKANHGDKSRLDEAQAKLLNLVEERPDWTRPHSALGLVYDLQGANAKALEEFKKAVDCGEKNVEVVQRLHELDLTEHPNDVRVLRSAADFYVRTMKDPKKDLDRVLDLLFRILKPETTSQYDKDFARRLMSLSLMKQPDSEISRSVLDKLPPLTESSSLDEMRLHVVALMNQRNWAAQQKAVKLLEQLAKATTLTENEELKLALLYEKSGSEKEAYRTFVRLAKEYPKPIYFGNLIQFMIDNDYPSGEVKPWLELLKKAQPDTAQAVAFQARLLAANSKGKDAVKLLESFAETNKTEKPILFVAKVLEQIKQLDAAESWLKKYEEESKTAPNAKLPPTHQLLEFYTRQQRKDEAIELYRKTANGYPKQAIAPIGLSILYSLDKCEPNDIERVETVIKNSKAEVAMPEMVNAALYNLRAQYSAAIEQYQLILTNDPNNISARNNYAFLLAFFGENKADEALKEIHRAQTQSKSPSPSLLDTEAAILIKGGKPADAIELLLNAIMMKASPSYYFHLAQAYKLTGKPEEAKKALKKAQKLGLSPAKLHPLERSAYEEMVNKENKR